MKATLIILIIIYFCTALLPSIIHGNNTETEEIQEILEKMAEKGETIDGIFKPSMNGSLGQGICGVLYKGTLLHPIKREIAMKFTPLKMQLFALEEYKIYSYLNAINNTRIERYGIPSVYYYGAWNDHILMGISLLDSEFNETFENGLFDEVDALIVMQQFLRTLKYIHSRGIYHNDIKLNNLMFRRNQAFIIDYNVATKMYEKSKIGTSNILSTRDYENQKRVTKSDWQSFFYSMCHFFGVRLQWLGFGLNPKQDIHRIMEQIGEIKSDGIKRVLNAFANYAFEDQINEHLLGGVANKEECHDAPHFPMYDHLYQIIDEEIAKSELPKPVLVSWLDDEEIEKAKEEWTTIPDISSIQDQFEKDDANYPEVNFDYFHPEQASFESFGNGKKVKVVANSKTARK